MPRGSLFREEDSHANDPTRGRASGERDIEQIPAATNACRAVTARRADEWDRRTRTAACDLASPPSGGEEHGVDTIRYGAFSAPIASRCLRTTGSILIAQALSCSLLPLCW